MYVPPASGCPPNPSCNATYPYAGCAASCGETAALCQDVFVFYYRVSRKPEYFLQNMLAPIILITIMAAAAYWNELDDYAGTFAACFALRHAGGPLTHPPCHLRIEIAWGSWPPRCCP